MILTKILSKTQRAFTVKFLLTVMCANLYSQVYAADSLPTGTSVMLLQEDAWVLMINQGQGLEKINTSTEARAPTLHTHNGLIAYIGADGAVHEINLAAGSDTVILQPTANRTFAQPAYDRNADGLYLVAFKDGSSADTDIVYIQRNSGKVETVVRQRSSQFEPYPVALTLSAGDSALPPITNGLLYSSVHCTVGCGKIIQEIWMIDPAAEDAQQLTLFNAISRQPIAFNQGFYFSSNRAGHFHIWRQDYSGKTDQITSGVVTDINPAIDQHGNLYFIRHEPGRTQIFKASNDKAIKVIALSEGIEGIRDLRIDPFITTASSP